MEIDVAFAAWMKHADIMEKGLKGLGPPRPTYRNLGVANAPSALTTQTLIIPQTPAGGRMWFIHRTGILGADGHTAATGVADVYAGPGQEVDATAQIYSGLTIPTIIVEGHDTNPVLPFEHIYVVCYSLAAQQQLQFVVTVEEYPLEAKVATAI